MKQRVSFPDRKSLVPLVAATILAAQAAAASPTQGASSPTGIPSALEISRTGEGEQTRQGAQLNDVRLSRLLKLDVRDRNGRHVGKVEDLVIDSTDNRIAQAVVSVGGYPEIGDKLFALPLGAFAPAEPAPSARTARAEQSGGGCHLPPYRGHGVFGI